MWKRTQLNNDENPCHGTDFFLFWAARQDFTQIYGQSLRFWRFVRNRHFSSRLITDSMPIFIDVSVNDNDFAKCSAAHHLLNRCTWLRLRAKRCFLEFALNLDQPVDKNQTFPRFLSTFEAARSGFGVSDRQKWAIHSVFCLLSMSRALNLVMPV